MPKFYTVKETAQLLGVSTNTIYKYLETGQLKGIRSFAKQGRFRISATELKSFLPLKEDQTPTTPLISEPKLKPLLPVRLSRLLLVVVLALMIFEISTDRNICFSSSTQMIRLLMVTILFLLSYQFLATKNI